MKMLEINVEVNNNILSYTKEGQEVEYMPKLDPNKYPLFCAEMLVDDLMHEYSALVSDVIIDSPKKWVIQLVIK